MNNSQSHLYQQGIGVFDFFLSYKQKDSADFVTFLQKTLSSRGMEIWLDKKEIHLGESILASVEEGIRSSIAAIVVFSENYFSGWSEQERRALHSFMVSKRIKIIPIWYRLTYDQVALLAPLFVDIQAIEISNGDQNDASNVADMIQSQFELRPHYQRLYELYFQAVKRYVQDPDLDLFLSIFSNDVTLLNTAIKAGANVNITLEALWNRYNKLPLQHEDLFVTWRKLFLYLVASGKIGGNAT